jgi:hypothetical protein
VLRVACRSPISSRLSTIPARRLIDRMGACVMGFDTRRAPSATCSRRRIKRVVQVCRGLSGHRPARVFQTVLAEFEKFPRALLSQRERGVAQGSLAGPSSRAARDDGDPVHDRAAQDAERGTGPRGACASSCSRCGPMCWRPLL